MSRGLGRIERQIARDIALTKSDPSGCHCVLIRSWTLAFVFKPRDGYPHFDWEPSRAQRKSVVRAMHSFVRKFPQYALMGGQGRKQLFLYEVADRDSVAWAETSVEKKEFVPFNDRKLFCKEVTH